MRRTIVGARPRESSSRRRNRRLAASRLHPGEEVKDAPKVPGSWPAGGGTDPQVLLDAQGGKEPAAFGHQDETLPDAGMRGQPRNQPAIERNIAGVWPVQTGDRSQQSLLPRPIGPNDR